MNELRCTAKRGSYWWHLRLAMLNYVHDCLDHFSGRALLTLQFRWTTMNRLYLKMITSYVSNVGLVSWLWRYSANTKPWSPECSPLIHANRGSCSISNCITKGGGERRWRKIEFADNFSKPLCQYTLNGAFILNYSS